MAEPSQSQCGHSSSVGKEKAVQVHHFPPILALLLPLSSLPVTSTFSTGLTVKRRFASTRLACATMAAISTSSPSNPTVTEHDWRFPRRPDALADSGAEAMQADDADSGTAPVPAANDGSDSSAQRATAPRDTMKQLRFDLSEQVAAAQGALSRKDAFLGLGDGLAGMSASPEDMAKEDPLATQVWRFFAKTKQNLPNHERMENLTWRMMHESLKKQSQKVQDSARYAISPRALGCLAEGHIRVVNATAC